MEAVSEIPPYAIALYPFQAKFDDELTLNANDIVLLTRHVNDDWIEGEIDGKTGIFPASYVSVQVDCSHLESSTGWQSCSSATGSSKVHSELSKSVPTNQSLTNQLHNHEQSKELQEKADFRNEAWCSSQSVNKQINPWLSDIFTNASGKKTVSKSKSFPETVSSECLRKRFIFKNKQAPPVPLTTAVFPNKLENVGTASQRTTPPKDALLDKVSEETDETTTTETNTDRLFGEFAYAATKMFRRNKETGTDTFDEKTPRMEDTEKPEGRISAAPKPAPRRSISKSTAEDINSSKFPIPAPRKSILKGQKSDPDVNVKNQEMSSLRTNPVTKTLNFSSQTKNKIDKYDESAKKISLYTNELINIQNTKRGTPVETDNKGKVDSTSTSYDSMSSLTSEFMTEIKKEASQTAENDKNPHMALKTAPVKTNVQNVKINILPATKSADKPKPSGKPKVNIAEEQNKRVDGVAVKQSENIYSEINDTSDNLYADIDQDIYENSADVPTLNVKETKVNKIKSDPIKIPPPPVSRRNKGTSKGDFASTLSKTITGIVKSADQSKEHHQSTKLETSSAGKESRDLKKEKTVKLDNSFVNNYYIIPVGKENSEENVYEIMWPTQPEKNTIPPPLPPKKRQLQTKS